MSVEPVRRTWSIRWLVAGAMVLLTAAAVVSVGAVSERNARRALVAEFESRLVLQARNLAMVGSGALLTDVPEWTLLPLIREIQGRQPELAIIDVVDLGGVIRANTDVRRLGTRFAPPPRLLRELDGPALAPGESLLGNAQFIVVSAPIVDAQARRLGTAWVGLQRSVIERRLEQARRQQALVLVFFLALGTGAALSLSSALLRPLAALRAGLERIGRGDLDTPLEIRDRTEIGALAGTINRMTRELKSAQSELVERERIAHEVQLAQRIQRTLLPAGRRVAGSFVIEGDQRPATEVGGDYFQMFELPGGRVGVVIADVSGKGLGGSLVTAMLHALLRAIAAAHDSPATLLVTMDRQLGEMLERGTFVTMFYGILDPRTAELTFASAGHNPLLILRAGAPPRWMRASGAPLAALRGKMQPRYAEVKVKAEPGDVWVQYTDGISEAFAFADEELFGLDRLAEVADGARDGGARGVLDALAAAVTEWRGGKPQHDDDTLLVISHELDETEAVPAAPAAGTHDREAAGNGASGAPPDPVAEEEGLACLSRAQAMGRHVAFPASLQSARGIDEWLDQLPELAGLGARPASLVRLAVQEACGNVIEHACGLDATQTFDVWWVPEGPTAGHFLLRDRGRTFRYQDWKTPLLADPQVRRRGRGFGLEIVRRVMNRVEYYPATREGNLTFLSFDPHLAARGETP
jgi:serine phosphatase RsbU (regulator of sigma subunit)/anti-sigma regulatory factor (Ser/Thr protein kinase)